MTKHQDQQSKVAKRQRNTHHHLDDCIPASPRGEQQHDQARKEDAMLVVRSEQFGEAEVALMKLLDERNEFPLITVRNIDGVVHDHYRQDKKRQRNDEGSSK